MISMYLRLKYDRWGEGMNRILLVEDDRQICELMGDFFSSKKEDSYKLDVAHDGFLGLQLFEEQPYDLVILDIMMPGMDGFEVCKRIRRKSIVPIVFITARGREEDVLFGYGLGCDDYIVKPFSFPTLYAKVQALLNRVKGTIGNSDLHFAEICIDVLRFTVTVSGKAVELPPKQYSLLKLLMENPGVVFSRDTLLNRVWGYEYDGVDRVVDNHIKNLRKALGESGQHIKTVFTKGYKIE